MIEATPKDKNIVIDILSKAFAENMSVNSIVKDKSKIPMLMEYSFYMGMKYGKIFLSDNKKAACILIFSKLKQKPFWWSIKLALNGIGLKRILSAIKRERLIDKKQPKTPFIHLWYVGVYPKDMAKGIGSLLIRSVVTYCDGLGQDIYLETSTVRNISFYEKFGFVAIDEIRKELPYHLYIFKREKR